MATIIMAHGDRIDGEAKTFVPDGTTIKFFGDEGEILATTSALAAVASGALGTPNEEFGGGEEIWNYHLYAENDQGIAQYMTVAPGSNTMVFCGPDFPTNTPLCTAVLECQQHGAHTCDGVLGRYSGDLVVLACRGVDGVDTDATTRFGGDPDGALSELDPEMDEWVRGFLQRVKADPDAAEQEYDGLPEGTKAMLSPYDDIMAWAQVRWVRWYANQNDFDGFVGQVNNGATSLDKAKDYLDIPVYGDSLLYLIVARVEQGIDQLVADVRGGVITSEEQVETAMQDLMNAAMTAKSWCESRLGVDDISSRMAAYPQWIATQQRMDQVVQELEGGDAGDGDGDGDGDDGEEP